MSTQSTFQLGGGGGGSNGTFLISINDPSEVVDAAGSNPKHLRRWLYASGLGTMIMDGATACYRQPRGIFEQHRFSYYAILAGIFAAGLAEVAGGACWLSSSGQRVRSRAFAVAVFSASVVPLAGIIALGGFSVVMKG
ncbi:unnamed protein product [Urochloa humidicola]